VTAGTKAVVTDIEGTITSIAFVKEVLFPYAREHLPRFVRQNVTRADVTALLEDARAFAAEPDLDTEATIARLVAWIDADRKVTPLKALQGKVWAEGYAQGHLRGHVYPDAAAALRRWHAAGLALHVYSSGSALAQRLLLRHSEAGDLTPIFSGHFDTRTGAKIDVASYRKIAEQLTLAPGSILFISDAALELEAATAAGMRATQACRDGQVPDGRFPAYTSFDDLDPRA
jgi:enolase-phosphatase E1